MEQTTVSTRLLSTTLRYLTRLSFRNPTFASTQTLWPDRASSGWTATNLTQYQKLKLDELEATGYI